MPGRSIVGSPPAFSDYLAVAHDHQAVHAIHLLVECGDEVQHRGGRNALCFSSAAWQSTLGSREHSSGHDNDETDSDQTSHRVALSTGSQVSCHERNCGRPWQSAGVGHLLMEKVVGSVSKYDRAVEVGTL